MSAKPSDGPGMGERNIKRRKAGDGASSHSGNHAYPPYPQHHLPPHQQYQGYSHGGGPPQQYQMPPQQHGYMYHHGQQQPPYGSQPHSQPWQQQAGQPPMYRQHGGPGGPKGPITPDRNGPNWSGYRGPPPQPPPQMGGMPDGRGHSSKPKQSHGSPPRPSHKQVGNGSSNGMPPHGQPGQYQPWHGQQGPQQWAQQQWGANPPPQVWQHGGMHHSSQQGPPPHMGGPVSGMPQHMQGHRPQHMQQPPGNQKMWGGGSGPNHMNSPPRHGVGPMGSSASMRPGDMMSGGYHNRHGVPNGSLCESINENNEVDMLMMSSGMAAVHDDEKSKGQGDGNNSSKDKNRGSYRCGRCGAPKKGHICPYQPKLKRRPDESPPEMRNAAVQVEMDEFLVLRRLNIRIQGFPESYASEPFLSENMVGAEARPPRTMGIDAGTGGSMLNDGPPDIMESMSHHGPPSHRPKHEPVEVDVTIQDSMDDEAGRNRMEPMSGS